MTRDNGGLIRRRTAPPPPHHARLRVDVARRSSSWICELSQTVRYGAHKRTKTEGDMRIMNQEKENG